MRALLSLLVLLTLVSGAAAQSTLDHVRRAQELLGPDTWSRALVVTNRQPGAIYPARVHALVFEFNRMLWIYMPYEGTQSLSTHTGQAEADRGNLSALLRELNPGFAELADAPPPAAGAIPMTGSPRNGCFIESLAAARTRLARGEEVLKAGILLYYTERGGAVRGHAVLAYATPAGVFIDDPQQQRSTTLAGGWSDDPRELAAGHVPRSKSNLVRARLLPVSQTRPLVQVAAVR
ncbi:MAG TPA: hypothetical protein PKX00_07410 [Opitutaceae bacterium]|jgi:hypothetical protein|nr:hypothetical protein [Opitutaceae bacterium]HRE05419.1 hypothetical protein [Opitutaceae bacterium]